MHFHPGGAKLWLDEWNTNAHAQTTPPLAIVTVAEREGGGRANPLSKPTCCKRQTVQILCGP